MVGTGIASDTNTGGFGQSIGNLGDSAGGIFSKDEPVTTGIAGSLLSLVTCELSSVLSCLVLA